MEKVGITREMNAQGGRYVAKVEGLSGRGGADLFVRTDPNVFIADHTLTPVALRHRGIATQLVERLVADARREVSGSGRPVPSWSTCSGPPSRLV